MLKRKKVHTLAAAAALALLSGPAAAEAMADDGALFTQTNDPAGNAVQMFDGSLTPAGTFATGGAGLAGFGGRQGAVELSDDEETVYAINAGSDSVTAFRVGGRDDDDDDRAARLTIASTVSSGGVAPVSVDTTAAASTCSTRAGRRTSRRSPPAGAAR